VGGGVKCGTGVSLGRWGVDRRSPQAQNKCVPNKTKQQHHTHRLNKEVTKKKTPWEAAVGGFFGAATPKRGRVF